MKKYKILSFVFLFWSVVSFACDTCNLRQPKITKGWTHGVGPESNWDWFIVGIIALITIVTLFYSAKFLLFPKEKNRNHIKNSVLHF